MKKTSKKFASSTTIYGLTRVMKAETFLTKLIWATMTIASMSAGFYIIGNTLTDFHHHDVFTQTKRIKDTSATLPAVTFCSKITNMAAFFQTVTFKTKSSSTSLQGETFIPTAKFNFTNCIKFNNFKNKPGFSKNQTLFQVTLSNDDNLVFEISENKKFEEIEVFISDNYHNALNWSDFKDIINPKKGQITYYDLTRKIETRLGSPYTDCNSDITDKSYRKMTCFVQCKAKEFISKYNCSVKSYYSDNRYEYCEEERAESDEFDSECEGQCPQECFLKTYDVLKTVSQRNESSPQTLSFTYSDLSYIQISQTAKMTGFSLISSVGGTLGLFIGIRFLSLVELLEYVTEIVLVFYRENLNSYSV